MRSTLATLVLVVGCSSGSGQGDAAASAAGDAEAAPAAADAASPSADGGDAPKAAGHDAPAASFDREAFCAEIFAPADVGRILGGEIQPRAAAPTERPGAVSCDATFGESGTASALVDCTGRGQDVAMWREQLEAMGKPPDGAYHEVDLGKGGAYAKTSLGRLGSTHQLAYVHDALPCYVKVNAGPRDDDKATALAEHVHAKLTADNRPR